MLDALLAGFDQVQQAGGVQGVVLGEGKKCMPR